MKKLYTVTIDLGSIYFQVAAKNEEQASELGWAAFEEDRKNYSKLPVEAWVAEVERLKL